MISSAPSPLSPVQQVALIVLRTFIGWHFLYEGYFKLLLPAWTPDGTHLGPWSSASYLNGATGPVGHLLQVSIERRLGTRDRHCSNCRSLRHWAFSDAGLVHSTGLLWGACNAGFVLCHSSSARRRSSPWHGRELHDREQELDRSSSGCGGMVFSNRPGCRFRPALFVMAEEAVPCSGSSRDKWARSRNVSCFALMRNGDGISCI